MVISDRSKDTRFHQNYEVQKTLQNQFKIQNVHAFATSKTSKCSISHWFCRFFRLLQAVCEPQDASGRSLWKTINSDWIWKKCFSWSVSSIQISVSVRWKSIFWHCRKVWNWLVNEESLIGPKSKNTILKILRKYKCKSVSSTSV